MTKTRMGKLMIMVIAGCLLLPVCILAVLLGEWVYSEIRFQIWVRQDEYRLDFSAYDDPEELKEAILAKLPIGSTEEAVQDFREAHGWPYRSPTASTYGPFGVSMVEYRSGRGLFGLRGVLFIHHNIWGIRFELNPTDHTLKDIHLKLQSGK